MGQHVHNKIQLTQPNRNTHISKGLTVKTIRFQLLHRIIQFAAVISAMCCIGCADIVDDILENMGTPLEGDGTIIANMPIAEIEVLLAESATPFK